MSTSDDQKPPSADGGSEDDRVEHSGGVSAPATETSGASAATTSAAVLDAPSGDESTPEAPEHVQPPPTESAPGDPAPEASSAARAVETGPGAPATAPELELELEPEPEPELEPEPEPEPEPASTPRPGEGLGPDAEGPASQDQGAPEKEGEEATSGPEPSANPLTSMLGSVNEARSWLLELPDFEGPLDLLLHLVRRHELDILDIPISFVTEKYLEYLAFMQALDLEVAGDYLVMAATLAYLKSRELVPTEPTEVNDEGQSDDEGPDPREELIARLLEYQKYRAAASDLDGLPIQGRDVFSRGGRIELPPVDPGLAPLTLFRLAEAYNRVLDRARIHKSHDVVLETVSVAQRMNQLTSMLIEHARVEFEGLFLGRSWNSESELRSMLVVTLMSVLELTKLGVIFVHQDTADGAIVIERKATPEEAKQAIADYDENISFGKAKPGVAEASASGEAAASSDDPPAPQAPESDAEPDSDA